MLSQKKHTKYFFKATICGRVFKKNAIKSTNNFLKPMLDLIIC